MSRLGDDYSMACGRAESIADDMRKHDYLRSLVKKYGLVERSYRDMMRQNKKGSIKLEPAEKKALDQWGYLKIFGYKVE